MVNEEVPVRTETVDVLPWQRQALAGYLDQAARDELPHALLLAGPPGAGKRMFAWVLARALHCEQPGNAGFPFVCGKCGGCKLMEAGTHPDLHWLRPIDLSIDGRKIRIDDARSLLAATVNEERRDGGRPIQIRIDDVRCLLERLTTTAQQGGRRIAVIEPADMMHTAAANALLKCLEEPGENTHLLLVSARPSVLLPTIRSRCQRISLPSPGAGEAMDWLQEQCPGAERDNLERMLRFADGQPLAALRLSRELLGDEPQQGRLETLEQQLVAVAQGQCSGIAFGVWLCDRSTGDGDTRSRILSGRLDPWLFALQHLLLDAARSRAAGRDASALAAAVSLDLAEWLRACDEVARVRGEVNGPVVLNLQMLVEGLAVFLEAVFKRRKHLVGIDRALGSLDVADID